MTQVRRFTGSNIINKNFLYDFIPVGLVLGLSLVITFYHELDFHISYNDDNIAPEINPMPAMGIITDRTWMRESARLGNAKFNYSDMTIEEFKRNPPQLGNETLLEIAENIKKGLNDVIEYDRKWAEHVEKVEKYEKARGGDKRPWYPDNHFKAIERGRLLKYYHEQRYLYTLLDRKTSYQNPSNYICTNNFNLSGKDLEPVYLDNHVWKIRPLGYYTGLNSSWSVSPYEGEFKYNYYRAEWLRLRNWGYRSAIDDEEFIPVIKEAEKVRQKNR